MKRDSRVHLVQERLHFTRHQRQQLGWLWRTYNDKMQQLVPRQKELLSTLNATDSSTMGLPIHKPGASLAPELLGPAQALVDNLKLMQACRFPVPTMIS